MLLERTNNVQSGRCHMRALLAIWSHSARNSYAPQARAASMPRRASFSCSWRLLSAWKQHELPCRATPFLPAFVAAVAGWFCAHSLPGTAAALLLGFHCLLRTQEFVSAQWAHLTIQKKSSIAVLLLPNTKSGQRFGHEDA